MMTIVTGTPGAGKTLNTIKDVYLEIKKNPYFEKKAEDGIIEKIERKVYACNISGIDTDKSGFIVFEDPTRWRELPAGSILIIDEASDFYPSSKKFGAELEDHIADLRVHRHYGIDIYYITQQPGLINKNIRVLCGKHIHYQRWNGSKKTIKYSHSSVFDTDLKSLRSIVQMGGEKESIKLDKKYFEFYKSTELDTHKFKVPWSMLIKFFILPLFVLFILFICFTNTSFYKDIQKNTVNTDKTTTKTHIQENKQFKQNTIQQTSDLSFSGLSFGNKKHLSVQEYKDQFKPRVPYELESAPFFDELRVARSIPRNIGCMMISNKPETCTCFTQQQGVEYNISKVDCVNYLNKKYKKKFNYLKSDNLHI